LTGEEKFKKGYEQLVNWGYPENTIKQKKTFPPSQIAPWDDNLALESYNTLLRYEKDPILRSFYLRSLERTFEIKRMEKIPWFNFTYAAMTGNDADLEAAVQHLREWTLDCTEHNFHNSHRDDLFVEEGYTIIRGWSEGHFPEGNYRHPGCQTGHHPGRRKKQYPYHGAGRFYPRLLNGPALRPNSGSGNARSGIAGNR